MRHANIQTTMNVYGRAMTDGKRQANSNAVQMVVQERVATTTPVMVLSRSQVGVKWGSIKCTSHS
jgi:hypothetical protein